MTPIDRAAALAHACTAAHRRRIVEARTICAQMLSRAASPYVSFSCGKDSAVLAHIVLELRPSTPLRFLSSGETRLLHNVDDILDWFRRRGARIDEVNIERVFSEEWKHASWNESRKAGGGDMKKLSTEEDDCVFMGLRAEESPQRRMSLYSCRTPDLPEFCYRYAGTGRVRCCPLARWRTDDIAAYIATHDIPVLEAYEESGIDTRTTARLTGTAVRMGTLRRLKLHHPDRYSAILARWPELGVFQ